MNPSKFTNTFDSTRETPPKDKHFPDLAPIKATPSLTTLNGCGFRLHGKSDYDKETNSYMTTQYFVILFIPFFPVARYRVISLGRKSYKFLGITITQSGKRYQFLGKGKFRAFEKTWWAILITLFVLLLLRILWINYVR